MNPRRFVRTGRALALATLTLPLLGCLSAVPDGIPETLDVVLPAGQVHPAARDTGPALLADSGWELFRTEDPDNPGDEPAGGPGPYGGLLEGGVLNRPPVGEKIARVTFDASGRLVQVQENRYLLPEVYGRTITIDGTAGATALPGLTFRSASFGLSINDQFGVVVYVDVRAFGARVGHAIIYAWGTRREDRIDGIFGYRLDFSNGLADLVLDSAGDQYPVEALRVE